MNAPAAVFALWRDTQDGLSASTYAPAGEAPAAKVFTARQSSKIPAPGGRTVHPIVRDMPPPPGAPVPPR